MGEGVPHGWDQLPERIVQCGRSPEDSSHGMLELAVHRKRAEKGATQAPTAVRDTTRAQRRPGPTSCKWTKYRPWWLGYPSGLLPTPGKQVTRSACCQLQVNKGPVLWRHPSAAQTHPLRPARLPPPTSAGRAPPLNKNGLWNGWPPIHDVQFGASAVQQGTAGSSSPPICAPKARARARARARVRPRGTSYGYAGSRAQGRPLQILGEHDSDGE